MGCHDNWLESVMTVFGSVFGMRTVIQIRVGVEEKERYREAARVTGKGMSEWVKEACDRHAGVRRTTAPDVVPVGVGVVKEAVREEPGVTTLGGLGSAYGRLLG